MIFVFKYSTVSLASYHVVSLGTCLRCTVVNALSSKRDSELMTKNHRGFAVLTNY